jgi:hypothetical protein
VKGVFFSRFSQNSVKLTFLCRSAHNPAKTEHNQKAEPSHKANGSVKTHVGRQMSNMRLFSRRNSTGKARNQAYNGIQIKAICDRQI